MRSSYSRRLIKQLEKHNLNVIKLPYYNNYKVTGNELSAKGYYINYLRLGSKIILPEFNVKEDIEALKIMVKHFGSNNVFPVNCNELAAEGGVLNCCSWTY
jgi:agmatine/peptidylarginine deiminase